MADQMPEYGTWGGDPGHSGAKPMMSLQGSIGPVHMQAPMASDNTGPARGMPEATSGNIAGWNATVIGGGSGGGDNLNPANTTGK